MSDTPQTTVAPEVSDVEPVEVNEVEEIDQDAADDAEYQAKMAEIAALSAEDADEPEEESDDDKKYKAKMKKIEDAKKKKASEDEETEEKPKTQPKKEKTPEKKIWKLKVNGKEVEFDATDEEVVKAEVQKGRASDMVFKEAAKMRDDATRKVKMAENFIEVLKTDPIKALSHPTLGLDLKNIFEKYLYENVVQREMMSPEQRQLADEKAARAKDQEELSRYKQKEAEIEQKKEADRKEAQKEGYRKEWAVKIKEAIDGNKLPMTDWVMMRFAHYMKVAVTNGHKVQPADVAPDVRQDLIAHTKQLFSVGNGDELIEIIGKDAFDKIRKANLKKLGVAPTTKPQMSAETSERPAKQEKRYGSKEEMMREMLKG